MNRESPAVARGANRVALLGVDSTLGGVIAQPSRLGRVATMTDARSGSALVSASNESLGWSQFGRNRVTASELKCWSGSSSWERE